MTDTRVYIVFYTGRPMDFQALSELAGVEPTDIEVKGEERICSHTGKVIRINEENSFKYQLPVSHGIFVQRQLNKLMRAIKNPAHLGAYCKAHGIKAHVWIVIEGITDTYSVPVLSMDNRFIAFLHDLNNAEVGFDLYTKPWDKEGDDYKKPAIILPSGETLCKI